MNRWYFDVNLVQTAQMYSVCCLSAAVMVALMHLVAL